MVLLLQNGGINQIIRPRSRPWKRVWRVWGRSMRKCIWCSRKSPVVTFKKDAHTFPKSLGGVHICKNVCDDCNHYFGATKPNIPAIEIVLKEVVNISKYFLLYNINKIPRRKRFKSEFFNINWAKKTMKIKPRYKLKRGFQESLGRQFRWGMYKVFLEERERVLGDSHLTRFDFIRGFSRYNLGDYQIYRVKPRMGVVFVSEDITNYPSFNFTERTHEEDMKFGVYSNFLMGHNFCIPTNKFFDNFGFQDYQAYLKKTNHPFGDELIPIKYVGDVDFLFSFLKNS